MTPRQRVLAVLHGEKPDKIPFTVFDTMIPQCAVERRLRNEGLCIVHRTNPVIAETPNVRVEKRTYTENDRQRTRTTYHTPEGNLSVVFEHAGFTNWNVERLFKGPEDYRKLIFWIRDRRYRENYEAYRNREAWLGDDMIIRTNAAGGPTIHDIMIDWMGIETFSVEWAENRDEVLSLERAATAKLREVWPLMARSPLTYACFGGNESPQVMGVKRFEDLCLPRYQEAAEALHKGGKLVGAHMDANNKAWAHLIARAGLDALEAFTPAPDTDMTLEDALKAWPDMVMWINFPSSIHLASVEKIKRTARDLIDQAAGTNRLIIGITEDMPEDRWQESLLAISDVINNG